MKRQYPSNKVTACAGSAAKSPNDNAPLEVPPPPSLANNKQVAPPIPIIGAEITATHTRLLQNKNKVWANKKKKEEKKSNWKYLKFPNPNIWSLRVNAALTAEANVIKQSAPNITAGTTIHHTRLSCQDIQQL